MKTTKTTEDRKEDHKSGRNSVPWKPKRQISPLGARAAVLSLIPGLGQLYNGETGKGLLFLAVSISNLVLLAMLLCTEPVLRGLVVLAAGLGIKSSLDVTHTVEIARGGLPVVLITLALILLYMRYAVREAYARAVERSQGKTFPRFFLSLPEATSSSYLFHFASACTFVLMMVLYMSPPEPKEQVTTIELVQDKKEPPPKPPKPPEPPKPKPEVQPVKQRPVKPVAKPKEEPKPIPVAVAVPSNEPSPFVQSDVPAPAAEPVSEPAPAGQAGGGEGGGGGDDGADIDFSGYLSEVQKRVKKAWFPPRGSESKSVTLKFKVRKDGQAFSVKLVTSSGLAPVDQAAMAAVKTASPFPPLPNGFPDEIDIKFTFDYNVFNGKM